MDICEEKFLQIEMVRIVLKIQKQLTNQKLYASVPKEMLPTTMQKHVSYKSPYVLSSVWIVNKA